MKRTILILNAIILASLFAVNVTAQQVLVPKKCYMLMRGTINKDIPVEINLIKVNDTLLGTCIYGDFKGPGPEKGKVVFVYGKMSGPVNFSIKENYFFEKGNVFKGSFRSAQQLTGTWENEKGTQKYPFEMNEKYSDGSIGMNVYYRKGSTPLIKKPKSPVAKIEEILLMPGESANPIISDTLRKRILVEYSGNIVLNPDPEKLLNGLMQVYFENYITSNESIYKTYGGMSFEWESYKSMKVVYNGSHLLSYCIDHYAFTGGAHGLDSRRYFCVDMQSGRELALSDLFADPGSSDVVALLTDKLKEKAGIIRSKKLKDAGYFVDEIKPSDNFYICSGGIGFFYNPYDIAPYSFGQTEIFLPFDEIKGLLKNPQIVPGH
jgi:hypothetical protein